MAALGPVCRRLYACMCVLLMLQEFHIVMLADPNMMPASRSVEYNDISEQTEYPERETDTNARLKNGEGVPKDDDILSHSRVATETGDGHDMNSPNYVDTLSLYANAISNISVSRQKRSSHPDVFDVQSHLNRYAEKLKVQKKDIVSKTKEYIKDCTEDHSNDIADVGNVKTPTGVLTRLILALLYTLVDCDERSRDTLVDVIDEVDKDTVVEVIDALQDIAEQLGNLDNSTSSEGNIDGDESDDSEETAFLSELLAENVLNTGEMVNLMTLLADGTSFENATDVEDMLSELDDFDLEQYTDQPNSAHDRYNVKNGLNKNAFGRPFTVGTKPSNPILEEVELQDTFFIKHEQKRCKVLSIRNASRLDEFSFDDFSETTVELQLWYMKENQIFNVGSRRPLIALNRRKRGARYIRLWHISEGKVTSLRDRRCHLRVSGFSGKLFVDCVPGYSRMTSKEPWTFVRFDRPNFTNFHEVVCMQFIQSQIWPCELMTLPTNETDPLLSPMTEDMFTQLWYISNRRIINVESRRALSLDDDGKMVVSTTNYENMTRWDIDKGIIKMVDSTGAVTVNIEKEGSLFISPNGPYPIQRWKLISLDGVLSNQESLSCDDDISHKMDPFVIRNDKVLACALLTVVDTNGTFTLEMSPFNESTLDYHLWVSHRGLLINVGSGLSLEPDATQTIGNDIKVTTQQLHSFKHDQMWFLNTRGLLRWKSNSRCFLDYKPQISDSQTQNGDVVLNCDWHKKTYPNWSFKYLPKDKNELSDFLNSMCIYFLRLNDEPCQHITAGKVQNEIYVRSLEQNLINKQMWYWNGPNLNLASTGEYIGCHGYGQWACLQNRQRQKSWVFENEYIVANPGHKYIAVNLDKSGKLFYSRDGAKFSLVDYDSFLQENSERKCGPPLEENTKFFFIRSQKYNKRVLTGSDRGEKPTFEYLDHGDVESQLWFYAQNHIINLKTNLALHLGIKDGFDVAHETEVVMSGYQKYANEQKWFRQGNMLYYGQPDSKCVLDLSMSEMELIVYCAIHGGMNQNWNFDEFNENSLNELTYSFFLRHAVKPCELLSYINGELVLRPPATEEFVKNQIWHWSGSSILHSASGLALDVSLSNRPLLNTKAMGKQSQKWEVNGMDVRSVSTGLLLGLDSSSGTVELSSSSYYNPYRYHIQWGLVDFDEGLNKPSLLSCEDNLAGISVYMVRSDKDPCHLLSEYGSGQVTLHKAGDGGSSQAWVKIRRHIVSAKTGKALTADSFWNGKEVHTRPKYEHEINQHWYQSGSSIQMSISGNTKALASFGDVTIWPAASSEDQNWVWLKGDAVRGDPKLLRCSKCYDKGEEKANEIISYIPIINIFYSLGRAAVYGIKGCKDVALETLRDFAIGLAFDIAIGLATIVTGGTATAFAFGVKTAIKSGIKAGIKAALKAVTSSIKLAVRQAINVGKTVLKQGLKKTVINLSKRGLGNLKYTLKSNIRTIKNLPSTSKHLTVKSVKSVKSVTAKLYNRIRSTTYGKFKGSTVNGIKKLPSALKRKMKQIGNSLADRAENRIRRLDDMKNNKHNNNHIICKRASGSCKPSGSHDAPSGSHDTPSGSGSSGSHDTPSGSGSSGSHDTPSGSHDTPSGSGSSGSHDTPSGSGSHDTPSGSGSSGSHDTPSGSHDTPSGSRDTPSGSGSRPSNIPTGTSPFVSNPSPEIEENFQTICKAAYTQNNVDPNGLQNAFFGILKKPVDSPGSGAARPPKPGENIVVSKVLRDVDEYPREIENFPKRVSTNKKKNKKPQTHTEMALYDDIVHHIPKNCRGDTKHACELYLWTKNTPCMQNQYEARDGSMVKVKSCLAMLVETCYKFIKESLIEKCNIGFKDWYGWSGKGDPKKSFVQNQMQSKLEFLDELKYLQHTEKNIAKNSQNILDDLRNNLSKYINFYQIIPQI